MSNLGCSFNSDFSEVQTNDRFHGFFSTWIGLFSRYFRAYLDAYHSNLQAYKQLFKHPQNAIEHCLADETYCTFYAYIFPPNVFLHKWRNKFLIFLRICHLNFLRHYLFFYWLSHICQKAISPFFHMTFHHRNHSNHREIH